MEPTTRRQQPCVAHVIAVTPFDASGGIDEEATRGHLRRMRDAGLGVYVGGGGSGEGFTLSDPELDRVLEIAVDELGGRVRAMGTEPRTAAQMVAFVRRAAAAGVEACQIYSLDPGHGHRPTPAEVHHYLHQVLDACEVPVVVSTHQSVGYRIAPQVLADLAAGHPQMIGVNCSHADLTYLAALVDAVGPDLEVCVGGPLQALSAVAIGASGYLSSEANLAPRLAATLAGALTAGELAAAFAAYGQLVRLHELLYGSGGIRMTKALLARLGLPGGGAPRLPQLPPHDADVDQVLATLTRWRLDEHEGWAVSDG